MSTQHVFAIRSGTKKKHLLSKYLLQLQVHLVDNFLLDGDKVFYRIGLVLFEQVYIVQENKGS
jgi:hypothetical protein